MPSIEVTDSLAERVKARDRRAIARAITTIENDYPETGELLRALASKLGHAYRIGITGPPGAGKSTLTNEMTKMLRAQGKTVGAKGGGTSPITE